MLSYDLQPRSTLRIRPLMVETLLLIRPGGAAGGGGTGAAPAPLPFSDLARLPLILPSARHGLRQIMERCASEAGIALNVTVEADAFGSTSGWSGPGSARRSCRSPRSTARCRRGSSPPRR